MSTAKKDTFLPLLRELAHCYQAFESHSAAHVRTLDLTPAQFDLLATLGNTAGMSFKELGEKSLITKGTLTGVVDRLVAKHLVRRVAAENDGRSQIVQLTAKGETLFARIFPAHLVHLRKVFVALDPRELEQARAGLAVIRQAFINAQEQQ